MVLGILVGMKSEAALAQAWAPSALVVMSGARKEGALQALNILSKAGVKTVISLGLAGGLSEQCAVGDIIIARNILMNGRIYRADSALEKILLTSDITRSGDIQHTDQIIAKAAQKRILAMDYPTCLALDMESGLAAQFCAERNLAFAAIRVVCDTADFSLPPLAQEAVSASGKLSISGMIKSLLAHPGQIKDLLVLAIHAKKAERALKYYLAHIPVIDA